MTIEHPHIAELERSLASLTAAPETDVQTGGLWLRALEQQSSAPPTVSAWKRKVPGVWLAAASVLLLITLASTLLPSMARSRSSSVSYEAAIPAPQEEAKLKRDHNLAGSAGFPGGDPSYELRRVAASPPAGSAPASSVSPTGAISTRAPDRFVIRKSTLDLTSTEVRGAFAKAGLVVNEALGEYVESSSLNGEGPTAYATITLRVAASRLSEVLNQLRPLGTVVTEATTGQDVTDTVVDLEARIRNEQRVEKELLALIDKRPDAPLKDLMEIRTQLTSVRSQIESLNGQRERVGRLVTLATVLVTIHHPSADGPKPAEKPAGLGDYFKATIADSWKAAMQALVDTAAFFIRAIIGGIVWWVIAAAVAVLAWRFYRRTAAARAAEPVPVG